MRIVFSILLMLVVSADMLACTRSTGTSAKDKQVAAEMCKRLKDYPSMLFIGVRATIMTVDMTLDSYRRMRADPVSGEGLMRELHKQFIGLTGEPVGTVWIYVNDDKVAEATSKFLGGVSVRLSLN